MDPLADTVALLQPRVLISKIATSAGDWAVDSQAIGAPFYGVVMEGNPVLAAEGQAPLVLEPGDFWLIPAGLAFTMSARWPFDRRLLSAEPVFLEDGTLRHGRRDVPAEMRMLVGRFDFGFRDGALLVSLLPALIHVRGEARLSAIVQLVTDEARAERPGRDLIVSRLLEVMTIEALRLTAGGAAPPGLLRGLADPKLAVALRLMHETPGAPHTVAALARAAALSRTVFFARFSAAVGQSPMQYLLRWRMALARHYLRQGDLGIAQIAQRLGYGSASAFTATFSRFTGQPPARFARSPDAAEPAETVPEAETA